MHCFSGSWETAREILDLGMYIGLGGVVTFKNARHAVEVARNIPLERLVLETDAPYMAPVPYRGKRNDSSLIAFVAEKLGSCGVWRPRRCWTSPRKTPGGCSTWGNGRGFSPERK